MIESRIERSSVPGTSEIYGTVPARATASPRWYAVWTHSHCERLVNDQLAAEGFQTFLPEIEVWVRQAGARRSARVPMFSGYLFMRTAMDKTSYVAASKTRGLVRILGERWDRLAVVPDSEIDAVAKLTTAHMNPRPHPYLREGRCVRITQGPLTGVEGHLVQVTPEKGLLVVSIELFRRSVSVEIDCTLAEPA